MQQVLQFVIQLGFFYVEMEGPEIAILKDAHGLTVEDMWLEEISHLIMQFQRFMFSLPSPESNLAALVLAQFGSSTKSQDIWIEEEPSIIQDIL
jgi:hypothetical protein